MNAEKQSALYSKYPALFKNKDLSIRESCMPWGLECGEGWAGILDAMCEELTRICEKYDVQVTFDQIKEKYGSLRVYYSFKTGESWAYKPLLLFRIMKWMTTLKVWRVRPWKNAKRCGPPRWTWTATHFLRRYNWKLNGHRLIEASRGGWSGAGLMAAGGGVDSLISDAVHWAERNSYIVCEICGSTVDVTTEGGWVTTYCAKCRARIKEGKDA